MNPTVRPAATLMPPPAGSHLPDGDKALILHIKTLNDGLQKEIVQLRSQLAFSVKRSANLLRRLNDQQEAARAAALKVMEKLAVKVEENRLKDKEAVELRGLLEESIRGKDESLHKLNKLKTKLSYLEPENAHLKLEAEEKDATIKELGQKLKPIQPQDKVRGTWTWVVPLTTVIIAAGILVYAAR